METTKHSIAVLPSGTRPAAVLRELASFANTQAMFADADTSRALRKVARQANELRRAVEAAS